MGSINHVSFRGSHYYEIRIFHLQFGFGCHLKKSTRQLLCKKKQEQTVIMSILQLGIFVALIHLTYSASDGSFSKSACITMVPSYRSQPKPQPNTDVNEYGFAGPVALDLEFGDK